MAALDKQTFDVWRQEDAAFKAEIRTHIAAQNTINLDYEGRLSATEADQRALTDKMGKRTTWLSAVVSAIVGALTAAGLAAANSRLP